MIKWIYIATIANCGEVFSVYRSEDNTMTKTIYADGEECIHKA
jgi:hypothetical protein